MKYILCFSAMVAIMALTTAEPARCAEPAGQTPAVSKAFHLEVLATTMTQIVLQWKGEPAKTASFELERATNPTFTENPRSYPIGKTTFVFSDTDREPVSKRRFAGDRAGPLLDPKTTYYYRVRANLAGDGSAYSNTVSAKVSGPARGEEGDLWADVVLGKPDFGANTFYQTTKYAVDHPGGVVIDKTVRPNRMYIADCNNNRVLGFKSTSPKDGADIVLGQPDFNSSAGNGDSCAQLYPYREKASARTLCLTLPDQISMAETVVRVSMTVDEKGNLYVPDIFNNRVLRYDDPFNTDCVADEVWGQADYTGDEPNRGKPTAASSTLKLTDRDGVALDPDGNLWVADGGNNRVLRFPKSKETGIIAKDADIVLGQPDFASNGEWGYKRTLAQMWYPIDVEFDSHGNLYVCDGIFNNADGRLVVFEPPFKSGMPATRQLPIPTGEAPLNADQRQSLTVGSIARDANPDRMWFENGTNIGTAELVDLRDGKVITSIECQQKTGIDVDSDGNLYVVNKWAGVYRFPASSWSLPPRERAKQIQEVLVRTNGPAAGSTGGILGITTFKDQLLIASNSRILIWNKWNLEKARNGQPADDVYGEQDFTSISWSRYLSSPQVDKSGRLWLVVRDNGHTLQAFTYPLTRSSKPIKSIPLAGNKPDLLAVKGGGFIAGAWADFFDFAVVGTGDKIWVADRNASRVFRINNVDGREDPQSGPYVDIVLGQNNLTDQKVHMGKDRCSSRSLAWAYNVDISPKGELLIADNGGECGTDQRILIYEATRFPDKPDTCLFADDIGDPDRVIGTGDRLDVSGDKTDDPTCSPFEVGISSKGTLVVPMNGYSAQRFPLVYLNPGESTEPQMALGDLTSYPTTCFIDSAGNVYVGDWDWSRVIIYKRPFQRIRY
jgi:sugar lactone lactonase YvrE